MNDATITTRAGRHLGQLREVLSRRFFWFLLAAIALAAAIPTTGIVLGEISLQVGPTELSLNQLMVAFMLSIATFCADEADSQKQYGRTFALASVSVCARVLPAIFAIWMLSRTKEPNFYLVGLAFTFAMPSAFSSIGWTTKAEGSQTLAVQLVLASTFTVPLLLLLIARFGQDQALLPVARVAGLLTFIAGFGFVGKLWAWAAAPHQRERVKPTLRCLNLVLILVLNYTNASSAFRDILNQPTTMLVIVTAASVFGCAAVFSLSYLVSKRLGCSSADSAAVTFTTGMYNTGLAIAIIPALVPNAHECLLGPLVVVITQHFVATAWDSLTTRDR